MANPGDVGHTIERELARLVRTLEAAARRPGGSDRGPAMDRAAYLLLDRIATRSRSVAELAAELHLDQSTVTRQVATLEARELARRAPDPDGGRAAVLDITREGRRQLAAERTSRTQRVNRTLNGWNDRDRRELARLLTKLNDSLDDRLRT
jgi:DNA-binding MarR family transcriptional regulator